MSDRQLTYGYDQPVATTPSHADILACHRAEWGLDQRAGPTGSERCEATDLQRLGERARRHRVVGKEQCRAKIRRPLPARGGVAVLRYAMRTLTASGPLRPSAMSISTRWPSVSVPMPERSSTEACTKASLPPPSRTMKPKPFCALNHLTVPTSSTAVSSDGRLAVGKAERRGAAGAAVLLSTLRTSVTCGPF